MTDRFDELPDELEALDAELGSIRYEERPSFRPELRAELARAWAEMPRKRPSAFRRRLVAAILVGLLLGSASVPSARASFVRLIRVLSVEPAEVEAPSAVDAPAEAVFEAEEEVVPVETEAPEPLPAPVVTAHVTEVETPPVVLEPVMVAPEMVDRGRLEEILQDAYPMHLQRRGVGGTAWLRLWVDETGMPGGVSIERSSGVPDLDRAALQAVPRFRFAPALQDGRRMGTWIEFPVTFEPDTSLVDPGLDPVVDAFSLPEVDRSEWWQLREPLDVEALPVAGDQWAEDLARSAAETSLEAAIGDAALIVSHGPISSILSGEAPKGSAASGDITPTEWRAAVGSALEYLTEQGTETPASVLALGRIRLRQGLRTEARALFERGVQITVPDRPRGSDWVGAELHHERSALVRDGWLASARVGRVPAEAFSGAFCAQARSSGGSDSGFASVERLIAWNYLCPQQLSDVFADGFEGSYSGSAGDLTLMMASLRAAVDAYPAHVGANTDLLVTLASVERWDDVLSGARRFTRVSGGHPYGLLLVGLALHRLERSDEASAHFRAALARLPEDEARELTDVTFLLDRSDATWYRRASAGERRDFQTRFWRAEDHRPSTVVNERWVEHVARASFARLRFGGVFGDAGEVWVRFGGPNIIHIVDEGSGRMTEFWDYGSGPDITFVRWGFSTRTDLTPEGRAYVDDLGKILPPQ